MKYCFNIEENVYENIVDELLTKVINMKKGQSKQKLNKWTTMFTYCFFSLLGNWLIEVEYISLAFFIVSNWIPYYACDHIHPLIIYYWRWQ